MHLFFALATAFKWHIHQMDVHNAFLNGDLYEEAYMDLPRDLKFQGESFDGCKMVYEINKYLCGLNRASRHWNSKLTSCLLTNGFKQLYSDYSSFIEGTSDDVIVVLIYVDDIAIASKSIAAMIASKQYLSNQFKVNDLG